MIECIQSLGFSLHLYVVLLLSLACFLTRDNLTAIRTATHTKVVCSLQRLEVELNMSRAASTGFALSLLRSTTYRLVNVKG
jgi:hypothetical protein